jgi:hypothetical protein
MYSAMVSERDDPICIAFDRLKDEAGFDWRVASVSERDFSSGMACRQGRVRRFGGAERQPPGQHRAAVATCRRRGFLGSKSATTRFSRHLRRLP